MAKKRKSRSTPAKPRARVRKPRVSGSPRQTSRSAKTTSGTTGGDPILAPEPDANESAKAAAALEADRAVFTPDRLSRVTAPEELEDPEKRRLWKLEDAEGRGPYMVELNVQYVGGLGRAAAAFRSLFTGQFTTVVRGQSGGPRMVRIAKSYFRCDLTLPEWKQLIAADEAEAGRRCEAARASAVEGEPAPKEFRYRTIYKLWPDFPVQRHITRSLATIKADAALRSFEASGTSVVWAVIDSGVDASHPHFGTASDHALNDEWVRNLHRCFVDVPGANLKDPDDPDEEYSADEDRDSRVASHVKYATEDPLGHGTHVAGIIAGRVPTSADPVVLERDERIARGSEDDNQPRREKFTRERKVRDPKEIERFHGVAPGCRIVSLRVLDEDGQGRSSNIVRALEYIRERLNDNPKLLRVHGVNLSVGYEFDAEMFACGQSPLCSEVNRLVQSGVVVVTAAGNTGYAALTAGGRVTKVAISNSINDPGNADCAITVGATHRDAPHTYGVSYFSSKGPTNDGRAKPDLVAPGERVMSCAAGAKLAQALKGRESGEVATPVAANVPVGAEPAGDAPRPPAYYVEDSGTSMAAPHVSGAIAAFLSIRREFIGRPLEVKRIFLESAMPLGRERYFEGHGLLDLMKAIQSV